MKDILIKICGINHVINHETLGKLPIQMFGLNFYAKSKRLLTEVLIPFPDIDYVGVFVNENLDTILAKVKKHRLSFVQLHGDESEEQCTILSRSTKVIKVFRVGQEFDFSITDRFKMCKYFLFDTYSNDYGGSGLKFDWNILDQYLGQTPFLLSGGIGPGDITLIQRIDHPMFAGVDLNSKFEISPGVKNVDLIQKFIKQMHDDTIKISS